MAIAGILIFLAAYATAVALPGPGLAALVARVIARGLGGVPAYIAGFIAGDLTWFTVAGTGLSAIAASFHWLITIIRFAGAGYLVLIAVKLIISPPLSIEAAARQSSGSRPSRDFFAGLALTLGNPKTIIFFLALLPALLDIKHLSVEIFFLIGVAMAALLLMILGSYALLANHSRRFFRSRKAIKILNVSTGTVMAGAAIAIVSK